MSKNARQLLDEAFADFDTSASRVTAGEGEDPGAEQFGAGADSEGDEDSQFDLGEDEGEEAEGGEEAYADNVEGEDGEDGEDGEQFDLTEGEGEDEDSVESPVAEEEEGGELFDLTEGEADADEGVYATVEEVELELQAIAKEQGLDRLPKGATASQTIDFLISTGAIVELTPITASERKARHAAFAADEFEGEEGEDEVESPAVLDDENYEEEGEGLGDSFEGIDLTDVGETEDDESSEEDESEAAAPVVEGEETEGCDGPECATASSKAIYHPVADAVLLAEASAADVQLVFSNTEDPRWNVLIAGVPAACIKLSSLENAHAVRATFCSDVYRDNIVQAMSRHGVVETLTAAKAEFYANSFKHSELAGEIRASVAEDLSKDHTTRVIAMRDSFLDRSNLVVAGLARGYFSKLSNPLLAKARTVLAGVGVHPTAIDAAALEIMSAAPDFFAVAADKAVDLMDTDEKFLSNLRESIEDTAPRAVAAESSATASFSTRLAEQTLAAAAPTAKPVTASVPGADRSHLAALVGTLGRKR